MNHTISSHKQMTHIISMLVQRTNNKDRNRVIEIFTQFEDSIVVPYSLSFLLSTQWDFTTSDSSFQYFYTTDPQIATLLGMASSSISITRIKRISFYEYNDDISTQRSYTHGTSQS